MTQVSFARHKRSCTVCGHPQRGEFEADFCDWASPSKLARRYGVTRDAIYRHARAARLLEQRNGRLRNALSKIIEHVDEVEITASAVVAAIVAMSKINLAGEFIADASENSLDQLVGHMTTGELLQYARDGQLPAWWQQGRVGSA